MKEDIKCDVCSLFFPDAQIYGYYKNDMICWSCMKMTDHWKWLLATYSNSRNFHPWLEEVYEILPKDVSKEAYDLLSKAYEGDAPFGWDSMDRLKHILVTSKNESDKWLLNLLFCD